MTTEKFSNGLKLTAQREKVLRHFALALEQVYGHGMGEKELAVMFEDVAPLSVSKVYQWQPFAFSAVRLDDATFFAHQDAMIAYGTDKERAKQLQKVELELMVMFGG